MKNSFMLMAGAAPNSSFPGVMRPEKGRDRAVSQAVSNFDLFQLDGKNQPNTNIERVTVVKARWQRLNTVIDGVRYYEI